MTSRWRAISSTVVVKGLGGGVGMGVGVVFALVLERRRANFRDWGVSMGVAEVSIRVVEGVGKGVGGGMGVVGKGMGVAGDSIEVVEGVGRGLGDGVGVVGKGMGVGVGASFRLLLGLRSFLLWPCWLAKLSVGVLIGDREWGLVGGCW